MTKQVADKRDSLEFKRVQNRQRWAREIVKEDPAIRQADGNYFEINEKRKVVIYDPACNNYGGFDSRIDDAIKNMLDVAELTRMPVETKWNDTTFQVEYGMKPEDAQKAFQSASEEMLHKKHGKPFTPNRPFSSSYDLDI